MADCFISYRRRPSAAIAVAIQAKLENTYGLDVYVDTTRTDSTQVRFPERLMNAIADAPVFICLLGESDGQHTLESEWVLREIQRAYELNKFCIPVFQESYRPLPNMPPAVDYLLGFDGVHIFDQKNVMIDESVRKLADLIPVQQRGPRVSRLLGIITVIVILVFIGIVLASSSLNDDNSTLSTSQPTLTEGVQPTPTDDATEDVTPSNTSVPTPTESPMPTPTDTLTRTPTDSPHPTSTPNATATLIALRPQNNADWTIIEREFNGLDMLLVPVGCFDMGSDDHGSDEQPVHKICFDEPFWIGKYEVTNEQYGAVGCSAESSEPNQPRNCVNWFDATDFCDAWGGRLPTEAEWEYAARGPDNWVYPWGDTYNRTFVIGLEAPVYGDERTAPVGSRVRGVSWVGAMDMSGNVWEWVSSQYEGYPYGSAHETDDESSLRVLRGGSFINRINVLQSSNRYYAAPDIVNRLYGFRCVRDYDSP